MSVVLGPGISASARLDRLLDLLATEGMISSRHAAHQLGCSLETIRKDLLTLEHQGLLRRAHGGALPSMPLAEEMPITQRTSNTQEKKNIAQAALMGALSSWNPAAPPTRLRHSCRRTGHSLW
jgi:DeoR family fructose operon transcriptional repressor